jgi:hypothetical protein
MGESEVRKGSYGEYRKVHYVGVPTTLSKGSTLNAAYKVSKQHRKPEILESLYWIFKP